jgi:hypothetical protein
VAEVKAGPDIREVNALRSGADSFDITPSNDEEFSNQCLFIRTLNATLNAEAWKELHSNLGLTNLLDPNPSSRTAFFDASPGSQENMSNTSSNTLQSSPHHTRLENQRSLTHPTQNLTVCTVFFELLPYSLPTHCSIVHSSRKEELSSPREMYRSSEVAISVYLFHPRGSPTLTPKMMLMKAGLQFLLHQMQS